MTQSDPFRIAAVQACPVFLDREASVAKACALIRQTGENGAAVAVFPEAFISGYPVWVWYVPPGQTGPLREAYSELHTHAITIPGRETEALGAAARAARVAVAIGVNERNSEASGTTLYNTLLYFGADGTLLGRHRKLVPTAAERLVWGMGDGSDLEVYQLACGRLSGLLCWENYMPLARYALVAMGEQIHAAPTWDHGEPWRSSLRHIAKESRCFVVGCCMPLRRDDLPDRLAVKECCLGDAEGWLNPGDSAIVDPDGKVVAGPAQREETILYADVRAAQLVGPRWQLDIAGHYGRPDIFELRMHRRPRPFLKCVAAGDDGEASSALCGGDETEPQARRPRGS